jgi:catechol 2,3-dioxygenase-like lactoylglutathione lyase family enzyme
MDAVSDVVIRGSSCWQHPLPSPSFGAMKVVRLGWLGTQTDRAEELAGFYRDVLQLPLVRREPGCWVYSLPDGALVEVFAPGSGRDHFQTGPVVGFAVEDLAAAREELLHRGIELIGQPGPTWQHFRGPDGNVYELVASGAAAPDAE